MQVSTLAGSGTFGWGEGEGTQARFNAPRGVVVDGNGNTIVADTFNHRIRKVDLATQTVSTVAGTGVNGFQDGPAAQAKMNRPRGLV